MRYELDKGSHSVYTLTYHHVCCVKYRRKIFDSEDIIGRLKEINIDVPKKFNVEVLDQDTDFDHLHMLVKTTPKIRLSSYIHSLKGISARRLFQEFPRIKKKSWGEALVSRISEDKKEIVGRSSLESELVLVHVLTRILG